MVDTIGAGDSFASGLLSGLADLGALAPGAVAKLPGRDLAARLDKAVLDLRHDLPARRSRSAGPARVRRGGCFALTLSDVWGAETRAKHEAEMMGA